MPNNIKIDERATGVLYHFTSVRAALNILQTGQFKLSSSVGASAEEKYMPKGYPYFLSTTRSRVGDYHRITGNTAVMFVLDGDWFNQQGYRVRPVDYWERSWTHPESGRSSESEDRVYSRESTMPAGNIRAVHVLIKTQDDLRSALIRQLLIAAKKMGLPAYLYKDDQSWRTQNRQRALPVKDALELLRGREPSDRRTKGRNYLGQWLELVYKKSTSELSDRAKYVARNLLIYNRGHGDDDMQLGSDLSNARKPDDQNRDTAIKIIELLKKYNLDTKRFVQMLYHKWKKIDDEENTRESVEHVLPNDNLPEAGPPRTVKRTYQQLSDLMAQLGQVPNAELKQKFLQVSKSLLHLDSDDPSWALAELTRRAIGLHKSHYNQTTWQWVSDLIKLKHDLNIGYQHHSDASNIEREVNDFLGNRGLFRYPIEEDLRDPQDNPCWKGYHPVGTKKKNGRTVPNCVPNESVNEGYQLDESLLTEIKMAPGDLRKWADSPEAEGIVSGFEAELIFRNATSEEEENYEPDYDQDERADSIDQVIDFFRGGDDPIGRSTAQRLRDELWEEYINWREEAIEDQWSGEAEDQVKDYMEVNVWGDDTIQDQYREQAAERLGIETSEQSAEQSDEIENLAREIFEEEVEKEINEQGGYWDDAHDYYRDMMADSGDYDESAFFDARYSTMSDIANNWEINWPYWTGESRGGGDRTAEDIAESLRRALGGAEVRASGGYHGTARRPGRWIIEPDGSLEGDDYEDAGLEIVSPPLPLKETLEKLDQVIDWANGDGDAYTNESTGLHMGVSVPYKGGSVDYVKLILFLGDQYVLDQFGRAGNSYTASAMEKLRQNIQAKQNDTVYASRRVDPATAMELMKKGLIELADRYVQDSVGESKYTSAHIQDGYIEFRSPGGDYLSADSRETGILRDTMLRFARAMHIASRPDLERDEYAKKLYKLIAPKGDDALNLFAQYSTGQINQEQLKKQWAEQVLSKEQPRTGSNVEKDFEVINQDTGEVIDTLKATNMGDAIDLAQQKWAGKGINWQTRFAEVPSKEPSRRAKVAQKIAGRSTLWRVNAGDRETFVMARDAEQAKERARQDNYFDRNRSYLEARPASKEEQQKWQEQGGQSIPARTGEPQPAGAVGDAGRYRVRWTEQRNGQEVQDSLVIDARNANAAMASVRSALQAQGREVISIEANLAGSTQDLQQQRAQQSQQAADQREYQIYFRNNNFPIMGFRAANDQEALERLEQYRQQHPSLDVGVRTGGGSTLAAAEQPRSSIYSGQWSGRWQVKDRQGNVVYTFSGVGNNQADANRTAHTWLLSQGDRFDNQGPFDVVPEIMS